MATGPGIEDGGRPIARIFGGGSASGMDEGDLLRRFASGRDPVALEVLVARHGPMVLGVCRRVLGNRHSAEDAFQATFLVLARKAGAIRDPDRLGPWLHGVAHRVAVRARADLARRNARERAGSEELAMETPATVDESGFDRLELRAALDEEVRRLPEKFRDPIVLCYLDGLTHDEAATRLRCPVGTVRSRLSTGRARLRERLSRRGVAVPSAGFAAALAAEGASASVSLPLLMTTVKAATASAGGLAGATAAGAVSAAVASLAEGVSKTMILSKLKIVGGSALAVMLTVGAAGVAAYQIGGRGPDAKAEKVERPAGAEPQAEVGRIRAARPANSDGRVAGPNGPDGDLGPPAEAQKPKAELEKTRAELAISKGQKANFPPASQGAAASGVAHAADAAPAAMPKPRTFQGNDFVIHLKPGTGRVDSFSDETDQWTSYDIPEGTKEVVPIYSSGVAALLARGGEINQVAVFVPKAGQWYPIDLKEPARGEASPIVNADMAIYAIGRRAYAFSVATRSWDVLELPEGAKPAPITYNGRATVEHGDQVYMFSAKTGKWAAAKTDRPSPPGGR
jgi:RNA polymerase sigma factor (sigma-70 family)